MRVEVRATFNEEVKFEVISMLSTLTMPRSKVIYDHGEFASFVTLIIYFAGSLTDVGLSLHRSSRGKQKGCEIIQVGKLHDSFAMSEGIFCVL